MTPSLAAAPVAAQDGGSIVNPNHVGMNTPDPTTWIPSTKWVPPDLRDDVIPRPRLIEPLRQMIHTHRVTLVAAPAGSGKTTLLVSLLAAEQGGLLAWLTLDSEDNDPPLLFAGLIAAIQRIDPSYGQLAWSTLTNLLTLTTPTDSFPVQRVVGALINDLLALGDAPITLVFDDLHLVTAPGVRAALTYLLEHLPAQVHLVVATRYDPPLPLARWRSRGWLAEVRLPELSFTPDETAMLLNGQLGLHLSSAELDTLWRSTAGWVAGLRLLASSLDQRSGAIASIAPQDLRASKERAINDLFAEEVLNRQQPDVRAFLLETAILEHLTPALCTAVTGRTDAATVLETLYRRNLFLTARDQRNDPPTLDNGRRSAQTTIAYRYHDLFADFLRQQLAREAPQEHVVELHRRAAAAETIPGRAIRHYLAAELWDEAVACIADIGGITLRQGLLHTLQTWIAALPTHIQATHPRLLYLQGVITWQRGDITGAQPILERACQRFAESGDWAGQGEALTDLATCNLIDGNFERGSQMMIEALTLPLRERSRIHIAVNQVGLALLNPDQSWHANMSSQTIMHALAETTDPEVWSVVLTAMHPFAAINPPLLNPIMQSCQTGLVFLGKHPSPAHVATNTFFAAVHFLTGHLTQAEQTARHAMSLSEQIGGYRYSDAELAVLMGQIQVAQGNEAEAEAYVRRGLEIRRTGMSDLGIAAHLYVLGRLYWQQGRREDLRQVYQRMCAATSDRELPVAPLMRLLLRALLELSQRQDAEAEQTLHAAAELEQSIPLAQLFGSATPLLTYLALLRQQPQVAVARLEPLLAVCAQDNTPARLLLEGRYVVPLLQLAAQHGAHADYAGRLLALRDAALPSTAHKPITVPETGERLTAREVEVLRLLATGARNKEIAAHLVIGESTVKTHVIRILRKLDVSSRTQAVARARTLNLFD